MREKDAFFETCQIIDGQAYAQNLRVKLKHSIDNLREKGLALPHLTVIIVGEDPASTIYVKRKGQQALEIGMKSTTLRFDENLSEADLLAEIKRLNQDPSVHGILVQLPLPSHMSALKVIDAIDPAKDVDGFHVINAGKLAVGIEGLVPCTPLGALMLLKDSYQKRGLALSGQNCVIVGRSNIVGKPMAQLLLQQDCTVTIAHSKTQNLPQVSARADILIAAVGRPEFITEDFIRDGATIIDVGINRIERCGKSVIVGDVNFAQAQKKAAAITPVPKGVGPMTIACLLHNTLTAYAQQNGLTLETIKA